MRSTRILVVVLCCAALAACTGSPETPQANVQPSNVAQLAAVADIPQPTPEVGKTTMVGKVFSTKTSAPLGNTIVRLAEVYRGQEQGKFAYALDGAASPGAITDAQGVFAIPNIEAREYVMVVGDIMANSYVIVPDTGDKARVFAGVADQVINMGEIKVDFAP